MTAAEYMAAHFLELLQADKIRGALEAAERGDRNIALNAASYAGCSLSANDRTNLIDAVYALLSTADGGR